MKRLFIAIGLLLLFFAGHADVSAQFGGPYVTSYPVTEYYEDRVECRWVFYRNIFYTTISRYHFCVFGGGYGYANCSGYTVAGDSGKNLYISSCNSSRGWCDNVPQYSPGWTTVIRSRTVDVYECHYIDRVTSWSACSNNTQVATGVHWNTTPGDRCNHVPLSRYCCGDPSASITAPSEVDLNENFNVDMEFSSPDGSGYTCDFTPPGSSVSTFGSRRFSNVSSVNWGTVGSITNPGASSVEPRSFTFSCTHPSAGCPNITRSTDVRAYPETFTVSIVARDYTGSYLSEAPGSEGEVVNEVTWTAIPDGGVPPYRNYTWSGDVTNTGASTVTMLYSTLGRKTATVNVRDSWNQPASNSHSIIIQDTRTPQ